jgi:hypothetical protein
MKVDRQIQTVNQVKSIRQRGCQHIDMSPDGEAAVDGGRASDAEVMARTAAMVALWARGRPSTRHTRNASSEETHTGLQALALRYGLHPPMGQPNLTYEDTQHLLRKCRQSFSNSKIPSYSKIPTGGGPPTSRPGRATPVWSPRRR